MKTRKRERARRRNHRLARQTLVVGRLDRGRADPTAQPWLLAVQRGVAQRRGLRFAYRGREETQRDVEPLGVVCYGGAWNLVAWCRLRRDVRHFRVDCIRALTMLDEQFPARPDFSLARHLEESVARAESVPVRVWFAEAAQERARRESHATLAEERRRDGGEEFRSTRGRSSGSRNGCCRSAATPRRSRPRGCASSCRVGAARIAARHA